MQTADLIFVSVSGLMADLYYILWLIVIAFLWKWPVKILAKMSSKVCMVLWGLIYSNRSQNLARSGYSCRSVTQSWYSARSI